MTLTLICDAIWSWFKRYALGTKQRQEKKLSEFFGFGFSEKVI